MKAPYKLLWLYILDECDHAGIWQVDLEVAEIKIGEKLNLATAISCFEGKIYVFDSGQKWYIPDFIDFQYGKLNELNRAHNSVINILEKYGLLEIKPLTSPLQGDKDKDKGDGILINTIDQYATIEKSIKGITDFIKTNKPRFITPYTDLWNLFSEKYGTAKVKAETETRKKKIKIRAGEPNFDFPEILKKATEQKFALESAWFNFDFLIENDTNYMKVLEGKYIQKQVEQPQKPTQSISRPNYE